mgnify:CR=1 FL=1
MRELTKEDKQETARLTPDKLRQQIKRGPFEISFSPEGPPGNVKIPVNR